MKLLKKITNLVDMKLIKFIMVGLLNTLIGNGLMYAFLNLAGMEFWAATAAGTVIGSVVSFFLNKYFTFNSKEKGFLHVFKFAINIAICYFIAYGIAQPAVSYLLAGYSQKVQENVAILVGMIMFTGLNYIGQRLVVFKENSKNKE